MFKSVENLNKKLNRDSNWFSYKKFTRCSVLNQHKSNQKIGVGAIWTMGQKNRGCSFSVTP
jgi:hypothetical protein